VYTWRKVLGPLVPGRAAPLATITLPRTDSLKRLRWRFDQFVQEHAQLADALGDIIPNLHRLATTRAGGLTEERPQLIIDGKRIDFHIFFRLLAALRGIPRTRIVRVESLTDLRALLEREDALAPGRPLIFARGSYVKFYPVMKSSAHANEVVIL
jgi:hypothetical protein